MPAHILTPDKVRRIVSIPTVAFPTIVLAVVCFIGVFTMAVALQGEFVSPTLCALVNTVLIFVSFTPMHDASHGSIAKKDYRWLNDFVGYFCGLIMCLPYSAFRYLHLQHHQHTNDVNKDPDAYTALGPWFVLPFRWMTLEFHHYSVFLSNEVFLKRPVSERFSSIGQVLANYSLMYFFIWNGYGTPVLYGWFLPGRVSIFFLALFFDYLPHRPHSHSRKENEYLATSLISLWPSKSSISLLTFPLLYQNYHNIHHLVPYIPFYLYETVWRECKDELEKKGTETIPIFGSVTKNA